MELDLKDLNILILTHYFAYGPAYDLEYYLRRRVRNLTIIEIPLYLRFDSPIKLRKYNKDKFIQEYREINVAVSLHTDLHTVLEIITRLAQYFVVIIDGLAEESYYDIAIAEDPIAALLAIVLRRMRKVRHVVFQSHAYTVPERGNLYEFIDYYVTRNSDVVWALSNRLVKIRKALGANQVIHTPICIRDDIVDYINSCHEEKENAVIYIGALNKDKGVDVLLELFPSLIKIFDKVYIVGEGQYGKVVRRLSEMLKDKVKYLGRRPLEQSMRIAKKSLLGLVLTKPSLELLTTDPMKPKIYIASHIPLIIPRYLELSYSVKKFSAGLVISNLGRDHIMEHISEFIKNPDHYITGAKNMAKYFNYWRCSILLKDIIEKTLAVLL